MVVVAGEEHRHGIARAVGGFDHADVARLARAVPEPVAQVAQAAAGHAAAHGGGAGVVLGLDRGVEPLGRIVDVVAVLVGHLDGLGGHAGLETGLLGGSGLVLGLGALDGQGLGGDEVAGVIEEVAAALERGVVLLKLLVGEAQRVGIALHHLGGERALRHQVAGQADVDAGAVLRGEEAVGVGIAVGLGGLFQRGDLVVERGELALIERDAVLIGVVLQRGDLQEIVLGVLQEVVAPGLALFEHGAALLGQRGDALRAVQPEEGGVAAVLVEKAAVLVDVGIAQLRGGVVPAADGESRRVLVEKAGIEQDNDDQADRDQDRSDRPAAAALRGLFLGLLPGERFLVGAGLTRGRAVFSFGRCAHGIHPFFRVIQACVKQA